MRLILPMRVAFVFVTALAQAARGQTGIQDGSFEAQASGIASYCYPGTCSSGSWLLNNASGLVKQGSGDWSAPTAVGGNFMAFIQSQSQITQSFTAASSGSFVVVLWIAGRPVYPGHAEVNGDQDLAISINGTEVGRTTTISGMAFRKIASSSFPLVAGQSYNLRLATLRSSDSSVFVDEVRVVPTGSIIYYNYDGLGRLIQTTTIGGVNDANNVVYSLDPAGNRSRAQVSGVH